jgi:uncharacterized protein YkwD
MAFHPAGGDPERAVQGWMSSTLGHRENILSPTFRYVGIGIAIRQNTEAVSVAPVYSVIFTTKFLEHLQ